MVSNEAFLPVPTEEDSASVPTYRPDGPGSQTYAGSLSVEDGNDLGEGFPNSGNRHMLFCGCCDFRRAVLAINGITIVFKIIMMIVVAIMASFVTKNLDDIEKDMDDDQVRKTADDFVKGGGMEILEAVVEIFGIISIALHLCGIYGALKFKQWGIITAGSTFALSFLFGLLSMDIGAMIFAGLGLYPHYFMYQLMKEGIMTDYNYHKIASCCGDKKM
jgi:hypothetical protein